MASSNREFERLVERQLVRVNATLFAIMAGVAAGFALFVATNWLVLKAGSTIPHDPAHHVAIGPHLALLGQYFIGYDVSFVGSLIGFAYAFVCAAVTTYVGAWLYNRVAGLRQGPSALE